jgi:fatty-acid desaturase
MSARYGLLWYEFDRPLIQIKILKLLGLAKSVGEAKVGSRWIERVPELISRHIDS